MVFNEVASPHSRRHATMGSGSLRAAYLDANDGLVSTTSPMAGGAAGVDCGW